MSYLNELPENVAHCIWKKVFTAECLPQINKIIWKNAFDECLPHIKTQAQDHYWRQFEYHHKREEEEKNQYKSYVNSRGNIVIERIPYIPNSQTGLCYEYLHFAYELEYGCPHYQLP